MIDNAADQDEWTSSVIPRQRADADATPSWLSDDTLVLPAYVPGDLGPPSDTESVEHAARQAAATAAAEAMIATTAEAALAAADHARASARLADAAALARAAYGPTVPGWRTGGADTGAAPSFTGLPAATPWPGNPSVAVGPNATPQHAAGGAGGPAAPSRPAGAMATGDDGTRLPSSERNMLIFVAMLLAIGAIAVTATMGVGKLG